MRKKVILLLTLVGLFSLMLCGNAFAAKYTSLSIYDTNSRQWENPDELDELVSSKYFQYEVGDFEDTIAKGYKHYHRANTTSKKQVKESIKKAFKKTTSKDINIIFISCHGGIDGAFQPGCAEKKNVVYFLDISPQEMRVWCDKYIKGRTVIITSQCYGGVFAKKFYYTANNSLKGEKKKNEAYAKKHYAVMTATNKTSNYIYASSSWFMLDQWYIYTYASHAKVADANEDKKLTLQEWYDYTAPYVYKDNLSSSYHYGEKVDRGVLYGDKVKNIVLRKYKK